MSNAALILALLLLGCAPDPTKCRASGPGPVECSVEIQPQPIVEEPDDA